MQNSSTYTSHLERDNTTYQYHINGMRGLAILMVLFYHMSEAIAPHGFIGVDIFLVISGYFLIKGFMKTPGEAHLGGYFTRRITRIYPSYLLMCLLVLLMAIPVFDMEAIEKTAIIGLNALLGTSNIYLEESSGGYFDAGVAQLPLVHTWYLSVLLQCYLFFALGWWLMCKWPRKRVLWVLGSIALLSFLCWNIPQIAKSLNKMGFFAGMQLPGYSYYWTSGRIWELLLGGGILLLPTLKSTGKWGKWLCLFLFIFLLVEAFISFKGLKRNNLPVVLAACTLIWLLPAAGGVTLRLLNSKIMQWLGTISFSLYLVHWPIIVYWNWLSGRSPEWTDYCGMLLLSLIAALLLYHGVEKRRFTLKWTLISAVLPISLLIAAWGSEGFPFLRADINAICSQPVSTFHAVTHKEYNTDILPAFEARDEKSTTYIDEKGNKVPPENRLLLLGDISRKPDFVICGDSHAGSLRYGIDVVGRQAGFCSIAVPTYVTPFTNYTSSRYYFSPERQTAFFSWLEAHPELKKVIIVQCWNARINNPHGLDMDMEGKMVRRKTKFEQAEAGLRDFLQELKKRGKSVLLLTGIPEIKNENPGQYVRVSKILGKETDEAQLSCTIAEYAATNDHLNAMLNKLAAEGLCQVIHQEKHLLKDGVFRAWQEGGPLYMADHFHLSTAGSVLSVEGMKEELLRFAQQP